MKINVPNGRGFVTFDVPDANLLGVYESSINRVAPPEDGAAEVAAALANPIGSLRLRELAAGKQNIVVIASDHTRPVPSRVIMPQMLAEIRAGNPSANITILIATGMHRGTTLDELKEKFGDEIVENETIIVHDAHDDALQTYLGVLPSGGELWVDRVAAEADLLVSEGFIEPHFFAGFSGGRKSVLPGIAGMETVMANHCGEFIKSPHARTGILDGNPIHKDMVWAAEKAELKFIVNVVINAQKRVMKAFAGDLLAAHAAGCEYLNGLCRINVPKADIVITSNGGYPLDQNIYQSVKGMTAGEAAAKDGGVIVMSSSCSNGHGGEGFYRFMAEMPSAKALYEQLGEIPQSETKPDQWQAQILARVMAHHDVIVLCDECSRGLVKEMGMYPVATTDEAMSLAFKLKGETATVAAIPDGVSVIVNGY
ncbi:MAG: nickel-dependent lactate racemase [Lentisphaeria bacterium]|nr:nickel-dependent lactate racemase [Lentisphaeria bacterium]